MKQLEWLELFIYTFKESFGMWCVVCISFSHGTKMNVKSKITDKNRVFLFYTNFQSKPNGLFLDASQMPD